MDRLERMVAHDIAPRGVRDPRVLAAMRTVPRAEFVPEDLRDRAHEDRPLPIGEGQTISQPFMVALMADLAEVGPHDNVLEVGTGSGYGAAVLAALSDRVTTLECIPALARAARATLARLGIDAEVVEGDGSLGWPAGAPWDAIVVTAAGPTVPPALLEQLADGGRLVVPVGPPGDQRLVRVVRHGDRFDREDHGGVAFVPLMGTQGVGGADPAADAPR